MSAMSNLATEIELTELAQTQKRIKTLRDDIARYENSLAIHKAAIIESLDNAIDAAQDRRFAHAFDHTNIARNSVDAMQNIVARMHNAIDTLATLTR